MTIDLLRPILKKGKHYNWGVIPGWVGFIKYDLSSDLLYFTNGNYRLYEQKLLDKIKDRNDLYYII